MCSIIMVEILSTEYSENLLKSAMVYKEVKGYQEGWKTLVIFPRVLKKMLIRDACSCSQINE